MNGPWEPKSHYGLLGHCPWDIAIRFTWKGSSSTRWELMTRSISDESVLSLGWEPKSQSYQNFREVSASSLFGGLPRRSPQPTTSFLGIA